jgi:hypothetical protein
MSDKPKPAAEYVEPERHIAIIESCVGRVCTQIEFSTSGALTFSFDNGVVIEISDGYCYTKAGDEIGSGSVWDDKVVVVPSTVTLGV